MEGSLDQADNPLAARTPRFGLREQGMHHLAPVHWNLTAPYLYEYAVQRREGQLGLGGSFVVNTGRHTGRSPRDKYIVNEPGTKDTVWWGGINQPIEPDRFAGLQQRPHFRQSQPHQRLPQPVGVAVVAVELLGLEEVVPGGLGVVAPQVPLAALHKAAHHLLEQLE